jgi:hypothetical protein
MHALTKKTKGLHGDQSMITTHHGEPEKNVDENGIHARFSLLACISRKPGSTCGHESIPHDGVDGSRLRGLEVQVLDHGYAEQYEKQNGKKSDWFTTHGDVFPIHGATMKPFGRHNGERSFPSEDRSKGTPEWNHYRIACTNGVLRLSVNGKEGDIMVKRGDKETQHVTLPAAAKALGTLGLRDTGSAVEWMNLYAREL